MFSRKSKIKSSIQRFEKSHSSNDINFLLEKIQQLDSQISETSKAILQAQAVRIRSAFSRNNGFLGGIQKKLVDSSAENSLIWHQQKLIDLNSERRNAQTRLDQLTGQVWPKRFLKWLIFIVIWVTFLFISLIVLMGFFAALYFLPFVALMLFVFFIIKQLR